MTNSITKIALCAVVLALVGNIYCIAQIKSKSSEPMDLTAEYAKMEETRSAFMLAVKEGRYNDLRNYVTPDARTVGPDTESWNSMRRLGVKRKTPFPYDSIVMFPQETVIVSDTIAYDFGTSKVYYTDEDGKQVEIQDSFLAIIKKCEDGVWRLHREVASGQVKE